MFVHQLIVACREYHSDTVRQERLGVLQQRETVSSKKQSASSRSAAVQAKLLLHEKKEDENQFQDYKNSSEKLCAHHQVPSTPKEPRQLPTNLITAFNQPAAETETAAKEEEDGEEENEALEMIFSPQVDRNTHGINNEGEIERKEKPPASRASPPWHQVDLLQLAQDIKDISTRLQTLETRLEQTNTQLMSLQTSSKAHSIVLEGRILAMEQAHLHVQQQHRYCFRSQHMTSLIHPFDTNFAALNAPQIGPKDNLNYSIYNNDENMIWNSPPTTCVNPLYSEPTPEGPSKGPSHPMNLGPPRACEVKEHLRGFKHTESVCINTVAYNQDDLQGNSIKNQSCAREEDPVFDITGRGGGGGGDENFQSFHSSKYHVYDKQSLQTPSLDSQDVLVSLRARIAEAQIGLQETNTALHLTDSPKLI